MLLTKYEQSGFILETGKGFKLAFDIGTYTPVGIVIKLFRGFTKS